MTTNAPVGRMDAERLRQAIEEAREKLATNADQVVLDMSSAFRLDASAVHAMEVLAGAAEEKGVKVVLRGVSTEMYKVLKGVELAQRFSFLA